MVERFSVVGKRMPDITGVEKVTGAAKFISDISLTGMLCGKVLHSPHAHARIVSIDTSEAERMPGVEAVVTYKDAPAKQYTGTLMNLQSYGGIEPWGVYDVRVLEDKVRYVGDAVAAVAAVSELVAEQALQAIRVEYEVLPAVFDVLEAQKDGAPRIHDTVQRRQADGAPADEPAERNLAVHACHQPVGDVEAGFREADFVIESVGYTTQQKQAPLETFHCIANFAPDGRLTVWAMVQLPYLFQRMIAYIFDIPVGKIRVKNEFMGGGFGTGLIVFREPICILLAKKSGKPVKLAYSRQEDFSDRPTRSCMGPYAFKMGVKKDGSITAVEQKIVTTAGAHVECSALSSLIASAAGNPLYRRKSHNAEVDAIYTNRLPCGAMRGFGNPEETFVREQVMDEAAEKLGMDPVEFRLQNLSQLGDPGTFGPDFPITSMGLGDCLRIGSERIGWKEGHGRAARVAGTGAGAEPGAAAGPTSGDLNDPQAGAVAAGKSASEEGSKRRGLGVSCMAHNSGAWPVHVEHSNALIKFNEDGSIILTAWPASIGTNALTSLAQVAAEVLGLRFEDVQVVWGDTDTTLFEIGSHASRTMYILGQAVERAAHDARVKLLARAADTLGVSAGELALEDRRVYVIGQPDKGISVAEVAKRAIYRMADVEEITGHASFAPTTSPAPYQALFAEVEVDIDTGEVHVVKLVTVNDSGRAINPMTVEGQLEGGTAQGLGYALWEDPVTDAVTGEMLTDDFDTYKIASTLDMPQMETILFEEPDPTGPFGAKGVGEPGCVNQAAAIANAIYDAIGVRIWSLPITPEKVLKALRERDLGT
ncbi:MAG TPA: molybdopterin cofactor-binding domain-containing protein [Thermoleophilia bacterium]